MTNATTTPTATTCPAWCNGDHLTTTNDEDGFHHDAEQWSLLPANQDHTGGDAYVFVNVAQFVPADGAPWPAIVELAPDNGPIVRLTPSEASEMALALLVAAKTAHVNAAQPLDRGHTMAPSLDANATDSTSPAILTDAPDEALHDELGRRVASAYRRGDLDDLAADLSPEQVENVRVIIRGTAAGVITTAELVAAGTAGTVTALADVCRDRLAVQR